MRPLNILMCCQFPLNKSLGGPKGYIEVAETYRQAGHMVNLVGINQIVGDDKPFLDEQWRIDHFPASLKAYIQSHHSKYDVIEYEAIYLPFDLRQEVSCLLVARNVLLELHLRSISLPRFPGFKTLISHFVKGPVRKFRLHQRINQSLEGNRFAHVVNVSNNSDKKILIEDGIPETKIVVQPYGISREKFEKFQTARKNIKHFTGEFKIAFVGSFDKRKGAVEFPEIIRSVVRSHPQVSFRLMGVLGMFPSAKAIEDYLGSELLPNVQIIPRYDPETLPELLSECSLGIFPSHLESFGFGVLEMMANGLPVVAYDVPGPDLLLPKDLLVKRGDVPAIVSLIRTLIENPSLLKTRGIECADRARDFIYEDQRNFSLEKYLSLEK
jgi:glycosyltransferase involved in cell wall biosynthesis